MGQDTVGPAVGHDVVQGDQQHMLGVRHLQQLAAHQRALAQVKQLGRIVVAEALQRCLKGFVRQCAQVLLRQREAGIGRGDLLQRFAVHQFKTGAQGFVTRHQTIQGGLQCRLVQAAGQAQGHRQMVGGTGGMI